VGARTGQDYLDHLQAHPREVWLRGERIEDVSTHSAFESARSQIARLYDLQHDPALRDTLTYVSPSSGERVATSFMIPKNPGTLTCAEMPFAPRPRRRSACSADPGFPQRHARGIG